MIHAKFSVLISSGLLVVAIKRTAERNFYVTSVTMFFIAFLNSTKDTYFTV
jgi:acyl-CoA thioesterase